MHPLTNWDTNRFCFCLVLFCTAVSLCICGLLMYLKGHLSYIQSVSSWRVAVESHSQNCEMIQTWVNFVVSWPQPPRISRSLAKAQFPVKTLALFMWWREFEPCPQICHLTGSVQLFDGNANTEMHLQYLDCWNWNLETAGFHAFVIFRFSQFYSYWFLKADVCQTTPTQHITFAFAKPRDGSL